jgi:hypothetical protein
VADLYLAGIGVPPMLYRRSPLRVYTGAISVRSEIVRIPWPSMPEARAWHPSGRVQVSAIELGEGGCRIVITCAVLRAEG